MEKLALVAGNVCLGLAALLCLVPLPLLIGEQNRRGSADGGALWGYVFLALPLLVLFSLAYAAVVLRGGLDGWGWGRLSQYVLVLATCLAWMVLFLLGGALRSEPLSQVPWAARAFTGWGAVGIPLLLLLLGLLWLNGGGDLPRRVFLAMSAVGLAAAAGLLGEGFLAMANREQQRAADAQAFHDRRDAMSRDKVERADAVKDFGSLLAQTSKWENEAIRALALQKVRSVPDLQALLSQHLRNMYYPDALTFLRDNEVPPAVAAALAEPIRDAMTMAIRDLRSRVEDGRDLWADNLAADLDRITGVANKYGRHGVDYAPLVAEYKRLVAEAKKK